MNTLAEEIQRISDDADRCINYPIGSKIAEFFRQQDEQNSQNFVLSGVIIYAAAKIFGRKVDCLEQEILGVAKNFEKVDAENGEEKGTTEPIKKTRTKKYTIKDGVNIDKILFEEKEIIIAVNEDISKALADPCKISRLQKMKDFFARNKEKSGKIAIPKSMLLSNELAVTNFGSTQIHDYDDYKDIVGSRRDFTSFSFFINSYTGELQNDLNFTKHTSKSSDYVLIDPVNEEIDKSTPTNDITTEQTSENLSQMEETDQKLMNTDPNFEPISLSEELMNHDLEDFTPPLTPNSPTLLSGKVTPININLDEGIEIDIEQSNLLMPIQPVIKISDFMRKSPSLFPVPVNVNDYVVMNFSRSVLTVLDEIKNNASEFSLPETIKAEVRENKMKNIFMVPIKRLKHKCLFDLPDSEFRELKRRKLDQHKSTVAEPPPRQSRMFKFLDLLKDCNMPGLNSSINLLDEDDDDTPFLGFSKDEQNESHLPFLINSNNNSTKHTTTKETIDSHQTTIDNSLQTDENQSSLRKVSNDSGYTSEFINSSNEIDDSAESSCRLDSSHDETDSTAQKNISGGDSCYQSLVSGQSGSDETNTPNISSFIDDFNVGNSTENEIDISNCEKDEQQASLESEERIQLMKQSAINVAKWKDFLKPILAQSEKRSKIDMHEYGLKVINKIGDVNDSKTFNEIAETNQMPAYFFTMLQLTNNRNIDISFKNKSIHEPTALENITLTLKSKTVHKKKFDEMGQHFEEVETLKKVGNKRKGNNLNIQTSTPAKQPFIPNDSLNFNTPNASQSLIDNTNNSMHILSQASSGYFSQNSTYSDF